MKKVIAPLFLGFALVTILASCGTAHRGPCEAYGGDAPTNTPSELPDYTE